MSDEPREDEEPQGEDPGADGSEEAPPPATWAGRSREGDEEPNEAAEPEEAGEEAERDEPDEASAEPEAPDEEAAVPEAETQSGMTDEFDGLEAELSADLEGLSTDEHEDESGVDDERQGADEQEEPPDEFGFEAEDADESDDEEAGEPAAAPPAAGQETVEVDTLTAADREAEHEAAHAGLKARTAAGRDTGRQSAVAEAVDAGPVRDAGEPPKRNVWWRFVAASFVIIGSVSAATAVAFLLYLSDIGAALDPDSNFEKSVSEELDSVEGGDPQTILILGSDKRSTAPGDPGRSDTTMLLRVDPDKGFLALLSLPRDLNVTIPGYGTDKLNAAYSLGEQFDSEDGGGPRLTARTVKELLGVDINHIVNVDFQGFYDAINAIGCVYVDVDRYYFNPQGGEYDDIDIQAGYNKLCGYRALDYVRYRHNDNDLVRGARQQSFIREARQQIPPRDLLPFVPGSHGDELIDIFTKHTSSDINDPSTILEMLKSFVAVRDTSVRQLTLGSLTAGGGVGASKEEIETTVNQFLGEDLSAGEPAAPADNDSGQQDRKPKKDKKKEEPKSEEDSGPALVDATGTAQQYAVEFDEFLSRRKAKLPVVYPTQIVANSNAAITPESRAHVIPPPNGQSKEFWGFKFVMTLQEGFGTSYYGLAGVNWVDAPILNNPSETRMIDGRDYMLFFERDRLRMVGWKTDRGAYWVSNTLTRALSEEAMLALATSARELDD